MNDFELLLMFAAVLACLFNLASNACLLYQSVKMWTALRELDRDLSLVEAKVSGELGLE